MMRASLPRAACAAAVIAGFTGIAPAQPRFPTPLTRVDYYVNTLAVGDLNGDGVQDLVAAYNGDLAVMLGRGDGTFGEEFEIESGYTTQALALADLDGDGDLDIVALRNQGDVPGFLHLFRGLGDGTFIDKGQIETSYNPQSLLAADLDGDGNVDLAVGGSGLSVYSGLGGMGFAEPLTFEHSGGRALVAADFDRDGRIDLTLCSGSELEVFPGAAGGGFQPPRSIWGGGDGLLAGDFDRDGIPDVVLFSRGSYGYSPGAMNLLPGKGDGTFRAPLRIEIPDQPFSVVSGDFNRDGKLDLAAIVGRATELGIPLGVELVTILGRGDGTFGAPRYSEVLGYVQPIAVADMDGDGRLDVATAGLQDAPGEFMNAFVGVLPGLGDGRFGPQLRYSQDGHIDLMTVADFDGDGALDVAESYLYASITLERGDGRGAFRLLSAVVNAAAEPMILEHGDFDGNGAPDLLEIDRSGEIWALLNRGAGIFDPVARTPLGTPVQSVAVRDDDGDGRDDLIVTQRGETVCDPGCHPAPGRVAVLLSMADGHFTAGPALAGPNPDSVVVCDFDSGAVRPGLAWTEYEQTAGGVLRTAVRGAAGGIIPVENRSENLIALGCAEVTGDGRKDLVGLSQDALLVWPGLGGGQVGTVIPSDYRSSAGALSLTHREPLRLADYDGDRRLDLAIGGLLMRGRGDGSFERVGHFMTNGVRTLPGDFNGDGWVDLASDSGLVLLNLNGALDRDGDGVADEADTCPTIANHTQDPEACHQAVVDAVLVPGAGRRSFTATWSTTHEVDVGAFNLYFVDPRRGRIRLNNVPIACHECASGAGASYSFPTMLPRKGGSLLVEMVSGTDREFIPLAIPAKR